MTDYTKYAQPWEQKTDVQTRIPKAANSRFFFAHNPENWELKIIEGIVMNDEGKKKKQKIPMLLPVLSSIHEIPGVNGTRAVGSRIDSSIMRTNLLDQGWTMLDPVQHDYVRVYPAHKGNYHTSKWIKLEKVGKRVIEHFDADGFDLWRIELMKTGALNTPHPQIASIRLISMSRAMARLERDQHIPEVANRLKSKQIELKNTKSAIARVDKMGKLAYEH
jgi:hypothetical protein